MREYKIDMMDEEEIIDAEKMTPEELYEKLTDGFVQLYIPIPVKPEYTLHQKV